MYKGRRQLRIGVQQVNTIIKNNNRSPGGLITELAGLDALLFSSIQVQFIDSMGPHEEVGLGDKYKKKATTLVYNFSQSKQARRSRTVCGVHQTHPSHRPPKQTDYNDMERALGSNIV